MRSEGYRIADEPTPGTLAHLTVSPLWPFVAVMFAGPWLSWSWFLLNGIAVGSPTLRRETAWAGAGVIVGITLSYTIAHMAGTGRIPEEFIKYVLLLVVVWKLGVTYVLYTLQSHSIEIYEYYGGKLKNGVFVIVVAYLISPMVMKGMPFQLKWILG